MMAMIYMSDGTRIQLYEAGRVSSYRLVIFVTECIYT
jgi:hypothetical protein